MTKVDKKICLNKAESELYVICDVQNSGDIRLGTDNGVETIFVTSGVHKREDIQRLGVFPDHVVDDLRELIG